MDVQLVREAQFPILYKGVRHAFGMRKGKIFILIIIKPKIVKFFVAKDFAVSVEQSKLIFVQTNFLFVLVTKSPEQNEPYMVLRILGMRRRVHFWLWM